jgi:Tol biopolymer transport system component
MIDVGTKEQRTLSKRAGISTATWSPSGDQIGFLATENGVSQIFMMSLQGGEAQQITNSKGGILHYSWSPDGKQFAFVADYFVPLSPDCRVVILMVVMVKSGS